MYVLEWNDQIFRKENNSRHCERSEAIPQRFFICEIASGETP